jgi:GT2 family glycosyltransferase
MNDYPIPSIFAVSLNWNGFSLTVPCVDSLKQSTLPFYKIIVLDQASTDGSGEKLRKLYVNDPQVDVICNEKNFGFAAGTNIGIRKALEMGAEFVFIVNNDTIVDKDCLLHLYKALSSSSSAGVAGPAIMYHSKPEKIWQAGGYFNKLKMGTSVPAKGKMYSEISHSSSSVGFLTGCALLIPSQIFKGIGFFDEAYFLYSDDVDFCLRIKDAGFNMHFVPEAKVWHKIEDIAFDRSTPLVLYHLARSSVIMLRKNFSGVERLYGIILRFTIYSIFRIWQILKAGRGLDSFAAWFKGLLHGLTFNIKN